MESLEQHVLNALGDSGGGYTTGKVAGMVSFTFGHNGRTHSAFVRQVLLSLERDGLVKRLDDQKPVCWRKA